MAEKFIHTDFLLETRYAQELYHSYAAKQPIIDYHCHLSPEAIAENKKFSTITEAWLYGDHYKWRAMRTMGIEEKYCTGNASDEAKFLKWAKTVPATLRNPLYHWTHLELKRYFDIDTLLDENSADSIYRETNLQLQSPTMHCQDLLRKMNVKVICTTDDPADELNAHQRMVSDDLKMLPTFRPDACYDFFNPHYTAYLKKLGAAADIEINALPDLYACLIKRLAYFESLGCRLADHGLEYIPQATHDHTASVSAIFINILQGKTVTPQEADTLKLDILLFLSREYHRLQWVQQFHLGALRNNNGRMQKILGPDVGFDSIGDFSQAKSLALFLNRLDTEDRLAKTILYNLNPADNEVMAAMLGNFNTGDIKGKIQWGSAWWFLDTLKGMEQQLDTVSNLGLLSCFVGMLTDSRSFLSFPRHEYFRRLLCNLLGNDIKKGLLPNDIAMIGKLVTQVSYTNAQEYFEFDT
ncbi:glucuronate isomerase [Maribacter sp. 2307ULW6-5]|uniref:glucuronate isomerase n=1 Tax=Maribacter sp. 2307ULW6-5 TaxID=3386275 RepID=UPI0039BD2C97